MEDKSGYFIISRKLKENFLHPSNEFRKFTKYEAWVYLIEKAYYFCKEHYIDEKRIIIPRGYFVTTVEQLSNELKWDRRTTEKYLKLLEKEQQIRRFKVSNSRKSCTLLKVNNYNAFQLNVSEACTSKCKTQCKTYCKTQCKLECTPNKELKKEKEIKENKNNIFITPTIELIKEYCQQRQNKINPNSFFDYYQSKGWMIGKNKMKDWKAAIRTWEAKEQKDTKGENYYAGYDRI